MPLEEALIVGEPLPEEPDEDALYLRGSLFGVAFGVGIFGVSSYFASLIWAGDLVFTGDGLALAVLDSAATDLAGVGGFSSRCR